jgi:hypothetical protein
MSQNDVTFHQIFQRLDRSRKGYLIPADIEQFIYESHPKNQRNRDLIAKMKLAKKIIFEK